MGKELTKAEVKAVLNEINQDKSSVYLRANRNIGIVSAAVEAVNNRLLRKFGLNHTGVTLLYMLVENGGERYLTDLTKKMCLSRQAVALMTRNLESRGLVAREEAKNDGRKIKIKITAEGLALVRQTGLAQERKKIHGVLESIANAEEAAIIDRVLTKVLANLRRMRFSD
jgi:DNA-binding MarR family transcriptional regulator